MLLYPCPRRTTEDTASPQNVEFQISWLVCCLRCMQVTYLSPMTRPGKELFQDLADSLLLVPGWLIRNHHINSGLDSDDVTSHRVHVTF